jgi:hypothetical protein
MTRRAQAKYFWIGIPVLFILGGLFHFLYGLCGRLPAVGLIAPVNESIFEHAKMYPLPALLWYALVFLRRRNSISADPWFTAALLSITVQVSGMVLLYYFYTGALGFRSPVLDIINFLLTVALGQIAGLHCYRHGKGLDYRLSLLIMLAVLSVFALLTVFPPRLPLFLDPKTGTYGIAGNS